MTEHARDNEQPAHDHVRASDETVAAILTMVTRMDAKLDAHMEHEEGEIEAITEKLESHTVELNKRIDTFMLNMQSYMDKQECIEKAFIRRPDGTIDVEGHHDDHLTRKDFATWAQDVKRDVVRTGIKAAIMGFLAWAGYVLWVAFIQGPQK